MGTDKTRYRSPYNVLWRHRGGLKYSFTLPLTSALDWRGGVVKATPVSLPPAVTKCPLYKWGQDSSVDIASHYGLDGLGDRIPVVARFSAPVQTGPGAHPASYTTGTGSFPGVKRPLRGVDHPTLSSAKVKEGVGLYINSPSGPSWPVLGWILPLLLPIVYEAGWAPGTVWMGAENLYRLSYAGPQQNKCF
jgi:hypothetical protein